ncbi:MAG: hypothetical protein VB140_04165 [Burkholderia sp.]
MQTSLVRNPFALPEIMPFDAIASSRSIYATTPLEGLGEDVHGKPVRGGP